MNAKTEIDSRIPENPGTPGKAALSAAILMPFLLLPILNWFALLAALKECAKIGIWLHLKGIFVGLLTTAVLFLPAFPLKAAGVNGEVILTVYAMVLSPAIFFAGYAIYTYRQQRRAWLAYQASRASLPAAKHGNAHMS